jgi:hypothetical protein
MHLRRRGAMRTRSLSCRWRAWMAAVLALVGASTIGAVTPVPARFREVRDFMVWRGEGIESHGLELTAQSEYDEAMAFRLFVRPQGRPSVIFSSCMDAMKGVFRNRLTDDQTGWWIEVREEPGVTGRHVMELFSRVAEARLKRYHGHVQTSEGDAIEFDVPQRRGGATRIRGRRCRRWPRWWSRRGGRRDTWRACRQASHSPRISWTRSRRIQVRARKRTTRPPRPWDFFAASWPSCFRCVASWVHVATRWWRRSPRRGQASRHRRCESFSQASGQCRRSTRWEMSS